MLHRIEERFLAEVPGVSLGSQLNFTVWQEHVHGIEPTNEAMLAFDRAWLAN